MRLRSSSGCQSSLKRVDTPHYCGGHWPNGPVSLSYLARLVRFERLALRDRFGRLTRLTRILFLVRLGFTMRLACLGGES